MARATMVRPNIPNLTTTEHASTQRRDVLKQGFTAVPNALLRHQARLGLTATELVLLLQIWSYWWEEPVLPYPSVSTLGSAMGSGERQIRHLLGGLAARGLIRILPRHSAAGAQVSNAYDLGPLLDQLLVVAEDRVLPESGAESPRRDARVKADTGGPVRSGPCPPLRSATGNQYPPSVIHNNQDTTIDEPMPARAAHRVPSASGAPPVKPRPSGPNANNPLVQRLHGLGLGSRDRAPAATAMRIRRLRERVLDDRTLLRLLDEAVTTLTPNVERPVPYVLAVLDDLVATWEQSGKNTLPCKQVRGPLRGATTGPASPPITAEKGSGGVPVGLVDETTCSSLWQALLRHVRGTLAPSVVARLAAAVVIGATESRLELRMGSAMDQAWCERMLRARLETALTELGHHEVALVFTAELGTESTPIASIA